MDRDERGRLEAHLEAELKGRFPDLADTIGQVSLLQHGDEPMVEPGELVVRVRMTPTEGGAEHRDPLGQFDDAYRKELKRLRTDLFERLPEIKRVRFVRDVGDGRGRRRRVRPGLVPGEARRARGDVTPVMARLAPADIETLDALITAGIATSRADAVRWALARIRERPAYAQLRERTRDIERLKTEF